MHQRSMWHDLRWLHSVNPSTSSHASRLARATPSKFDLDQCRGWQRAEYLASDSNIHGGQRCAYSPSFDRYSPKGSLACRGRGDLASPVETASAGSDVVCLPTTTVSTELNRSRAAQRR